MEKKYIIEEITKGEIDDLISKRLDTLIKSREFKSKVKEISGGVVEELFKILWTRKSFWSEPIKK